ncbi:MAG: hypothetical protein LBU66_06205 [Treponema sp.]|nr:hypothetical protein [Treponema sp.]
MLKENLPQSTRSFTENINKLINKKLQVCLHINSPFAPWLVLLLLLAIMFIGCPLDDGEVEDTGFIPVGEWSFGEEPMIEGYKITSSHVEYFSPDYGADFPPQNIKGSIQESVDFSSNAGVLIIKITSVENITLTPGNYTCVYYRDYTQSSVKLANPLDTSWNPVETDTFDAARKTFTVDNVSTHVSYWGTYTK